MAQDLGSATGSAGQSAERMLRVGILTQVADLEPWSAGDLVSLLATAQIFETPMALPDDDGEPEPLLFDGPLARTAGPQGDVYTGRVRAGVRFSDGTELTARHVVDSLRHVETLRTQAEIEADGDLVVFRLGRTDPRFPLALTLTHCGVALERGGEVLGTGPFRRRAGSRLDRLVLEPNPHCRHQVRVAGIEFVVHPPDADGKPSDLVRAVADADIDFTNMLSRSDVAELQGCRKKFQPSISTALLFLNTERPALADVHVRRAVAHAIDRRSLTEISYSNVVAFTASSPLPPRLGLTGERLRHDPEAAKDLVARTTGGAPRMPLRLLLVWAPRPYLPHPRAVAERIAEQLEAVGLPVRIIEPIDADDFFDRQKSSDYDLLLGGWIADVADPAEFLTALFHSRRVPRHGVRAVAQGNFARIADPELDAALERYQVDDDTDALEAVLDQVADLAPAVPLMYGATVLVHGWNVRGLEISPYGVPGFAGVSID